jgi:CAAX protease family protein
MRIAQFSLPIGPSSRQGKARLAHCHPQKRRKNAAKDEVWQLIRRLRKERAGLRLAIAAEGGLAALALLLAWIFGVRLRDQLPASPVDFSRAGTRGVVATLPLLATFWWLVHSAWPEARRLRQQVERLINELFPHASLVELAAIAVVAGVGEELLFRGVAQPLVARWTTPVAGLIIVSCIFGLFHAVSLLYFALAAVVGAYFGWLVLEFGDLVEPIVAHSLYDFLALAYLTRHIGDRNSSARDASLSNSSESEHEPSND